jgi:tetratricopeptide (TPR) repeat protein
VIDIFVPRYRHTARLWPGGFFLVLILLASGCATPQSDRLLASPSAHTPAVELMAVPFFAQTQYQCGPASLAMVLNWAGIPITPEELAPQVYLPERQGSLQAELLAAARRQGRVPYVLSPQLEALVTEVQAGNPVLVLQNLGYSWTPKWHYAVVVGVDLPREEMVLRSGVEARHVVSMQLFEHTWARSGHWAMVVTTPARLPQTAEELLYLRSVATLERVNRHAEAAAAYSAALQRWPTSLGAQLGLGNSRYAVGDLAGAEAIFRQALEVHPDTAVVLNNLAQTLADRGQFAQAQPLAVRATQLEPTNALYRETLADIRRRATRDSP